MRSPGSCQNSLALRITTFFYASQIALLLLVKLRLTGRSRCENAAARGQFNKADFGYDSEKDVYICPTGENLTYRFSGQQDGKAIRSYWSSACAVCVIKDKCTTSKERRVRRWEKEGVLERV